MLEVGDDIDQDGPVEPWLDRLHPDDAPSVRALAELRLPDDDPSFTVEFRIQAGNGGWRWMYTRGYAERNSRGFSTKLFGSTTDITSTRRNPCLRCGADEGTRTCDGVHCGGNLAPGAIEIADTILPCPRAEVRAERVIAGAYRLVEAVAMGAAGTVFRAERISDGQVCAVKVLHHWLLGVTDALERFAKESRLQRKLKHPNIVALFDVVVEDDVNAIVMEYVPGPTLTKFLESGACPSDPVARVEMFLPVLAAMEVAHRNKVIHRDIKPDNILVLDDGVRPVLKVTDFGLARNERLSTMTMPGVTMGTARYMSPEQFVDARLADRRTDIYAIGCCLYEMLTGQPMFDYEADFKILIAHLDEPPRHPSDVEPAIPRRLGDAVLRAVSKKPEHRPQSCNEFATDLVRALEG